MTALTFMAGAALLILAAMVFVVALMLGVLVIGTLAQAIHKLSDR